MSVTGLPDEVRELLVSVATPLEVLAGEDVAEHGVVGTMAIVSAGRIAVVVRADGTRSRTIALLQEGDALVMPAEDWQGAPDARAVAATDSEVLIVTGALDEVVALDPAAGAWLVRALAQAVADRELSTAIALEPRLERRLLLKLRQLAERWGRVTPDGVRLDLRVTHQELADMVGAARESVTVAFGRLQDQGEIDLNRRTVMIRRMTD